LLNQYPITKKSLKVHPNHIPLSPLATTAHAQSSPAHPT